MKQAFNIFKQDLRNIKRVPLMGLLLIGLAVLPSLYAWFNLSASWDPYSNTSEIKIAIVNEDAGAEIEGKSLNVGDELIRNLQENEDLGWQFVSRKKAEKGVEDGTYYASIYIDEGFSEGLAKVLDGEPEPVDVFYQVNEKLNAIAPKMTSAGANTIVSNITEQIIEEASKALFTEFNNIGIQLEEQLPTFRRIKSNVFALEDRLPEIEKFAEVVIDIDSEWGKVQEKTDRFLEFKDLIPKINNAADKVILLEERFSQINSLGDKVLELEDFLPTMKVAWERFARINEHFDDVSDQLDQALEGVHSAQSGVKRAQDALPLITNKTEEIESYIEALTLFVDRTTEAAEPVIDIAIDNIEYAKETAIAIDEALEKVQEAESPKKVLEHLDRLDDRLESSLETLNATSHLLEKLNNFLPRKPFQRMVDRLNDITEKMENVQQEVQGVLRAGDIADEKIPEIREKAKDVERVADRLYDYFVSEGKQVILDGLDQIADKLSNADETVHEVQSHLPEVEEILNNAERIVQTGEKRINELIDLLPRVEREIDELIVRIEYEFPKAERAILEASRFVTEDLPQIEKKVHQVSEFLRDDLEDIEREYYKAADQIEEYMPKIETALHDLASFANDELPEFTSKIRDVAKRIREFDSSHDLNELINLLKNDIEKESEFFAHPIQLNEEKLFPIPNYGSANAPFYTALSLWVGALLLSNLISTNVHELDRREDYKIPHIYLGRLFLFLIVGFFQGLIVSLGNLFILDAYAAHPFWFVVFTIFIALVFMTIVYTLASVFGNIGKALAVVLMVLQLSGAGGTFPIQVAPPFFQTIHPFLPFTYAINLLREAVGGIVTAVVWKQIAFLSFAWISALAFGLLLKKPLAARISKTMEKSKSSRLME